MLDAAHGTPCRTPQIGKRIRPVELEVEPGSMGRSGRKRGRRDKIAVGSDIRQHSRFIGAVARSRRKRAITMRNAAEGANNGFTANVNAVHLVRNVGRSLRGTFAGLRCGRLRPAWLEEPNDGDSKSFARTGCDRPTSTTLLCHSERSEESFPLRTKGCGRTMPSKEERDKRSAVKNLSTYTFIPILRRSAPQNDNAVFALNHFLSGTHSSARPGRLRGSHL